MELLCHSSHASGSGYTMSVEAAQVIWSSTCEFAVVLTKKYCVEHQERVFASMTLLEGQL